MGCGGRKDSDNADLIRGFTIHVVGGLTEDGCEKVELCPGAIVYSYTLVVRHPGGELGVPEIGAVLHLQDSQLDIYMAECKTVSLSADLPGLQWPAFAKLCVAAGGTATLYLTYGQCT